MQKCSGHCCIHKERCLHYKEGKKKTKTVIGANSFNINKKDSAEAFSKSHEWCDKQIEIIEANSKIYND